MDKVAMDNGAVTELDAIVARISVASSKLNRSAEQATRTIEELEERLVDAEPGTSVWGPVLLSEKTSFQRDDSVPAETAQRVVTLGFSKVKKKRWGIVVREEYKGKRDAVLQEELTQLRKADRSLRILAVPHLPGLAQQIVSELDAQVARLETAAREHEALIDGAAQASAEPRAPQASA